MYIDFDFINWNKYINAERSNKFIASKIKKEEKQIVSLLCRNWKPITKYPIKIIVTKYIKTRNTDIDNIRIKGLLDGLVELGVLKNDNLSSISEITYRAIVDKNKDGIDIQFLEVKDEQK